MDVIVGRRVIVTGSRGWEMGEFALRVLDGLERRHGRILTIVHGDCPTGVDWSFASACRIVGVRAEPHPADWDRFGRGAGPRRNQEMVDLGADVCLAFHPHLSTSKGTRDCVQRALKAGIPTWWCWGEDDPPIRQKLPGPMPSIDESSLSPLRVIRPKI